MHGPLNVKFSTGCEPIWNSDLTSLDTTCNVTSPCHSSFIKFLTNRMQGQKILLVLKLAALTTLAPSTQVTPQKTEVLSVFHLHYAIGNTMKDSIPGTDGLCLFSSWCRLTADSKGLGSFPGTKWPQLEGNCSPLSSTKVMNAWSYTSTSQCLHAVVQN